MNRETGRENGKRKVYKEQPHNTGGKKHTTES